MRIALVIPGTLETTSGGYLYDRRLLAHLRAAGHDVEVVSLAEGSLPRRLAENLRPPPDALRSVDLVVVDALAEPSFVRAINHLDKPVVGLFHMAMSRAGDGPIRPLMRAVERRFLAGLDAAIFNSEATRRDVVALGDSVPSLVAPPGKDRFEPSGMDVDAPADDTDAIDLLYLGNVVKRKGLDLLVDALASVDLDWSLTVVGDDGIEPRFVRQVRSRIDRYDVAPRVRWKGRLADGAVAAQLARADVLAVTSRYEPFGLVYLEGMGFGCVPVASATGGAREFITDGDSGLVVPPDPIVIARALQTLEDRHRLTALATGARCAYDRQPTWAESLDRIEAFLEAIAMEPEAIPHRLEPVDR